MKKVALLLVLGIFLVSACAQQDPSSLVGGGSEVPKQEAQEGQKASEGAVKEFKVTAKRFSFDPSTIEVNRGDKVRLIVESTDVAHGMSIPEYGINERLEPGQPVTIEFTADKQGTFTMMCSVLCGSGHSNMKGKIVVT